ncbi:MAG: hypothetical protein ACRD0W_00945 [Acidimicrobiales bacterium]
MPEDRDIAAEAEADRRERAASIRVFVPDPYRGTHLVFVYDIDPNGDGNAHVISSPDFHPQSMDLRRRVIAAALCRWAANRLEYGLPDGGIER